MPHPPPGLLAIGILGVLCGCTGAPTTDVSVTDGADPTTTDGSDPTTTSGTTGDTGATTTTPPVDPVLVIPHAQGLALANLDGSVAFNETWNDLIGNCAQCGGEGASPDGDGLLVSFTTGGGFGSGDAIARLDETFTLDFRLDGFAFPHDVIRDPADDTLMVVETFRDRVVWIAGDGSSDDALRELDMGDAGFGLLPNGAERLEHEGRTYLLLSHLGEGSNAPSANTGTISLWDITDPAGTTHVWTFPEHGMLSTPHGPILREIDGAWWLLWAHTYGAGQQDGGSVGMAVTSSLTTRPTYTADLTVPEGIDRLGFLRGVERSPTNTLLFLDSGGGGGAVGRLLEASWPVDLAPTGTTGAPTDRTYVTLTDATVVASGLRLPFEAWLWER